jgi:hypothetical protein
MSDVVESQPETPIQNQELPCVAPDSEDASKYLERAVALAELQKWCEARRTTWPDVRDVLLPDSQWYWPSGFGSERRSHRRIDFSEIPAVLSDIVSSKLSHPRTLALLNYYLGFLAELIIADSLADEKAAIQICGFLEVGIGPASFGFDTDPPFMGLLTPSSDAEPAESDLLAQIGQSISACLGSFK